MAASEVGLSRVFRRCGNMYLECFSVFLSDDGKDYGVGTD